MNRELAEKWVEWLLSPTNIQGYGKLHNTDGAYCCLGGLCEVVSHATGRGQWVDNGRDYYSFTDGSSEGEIPRSVASVLPDWLVEYAGLGDINPWFKIACWCDTQDENCYGCHGRGWLTSTATGLNDIKGWSFSQIAAIVRAQLIEAGGDGSSDSALDMTPFDRTDH